MRQTLRFAAAGLLLLLLAMPATALNLNKSIKIAPGSQAGGQSTVNGSISVGEGAVIDGSLETVNGSIRVDDNVRLKDAETVNGTIRIGSGASTDDISSVNGSIRLGQNVTVGGEIEVVNGKISLDTGTRVTDGVSNVNGEIVLAGARVGGNLSTVNGDVTVTEGSTLEGDLIVDKPGGWSNDRRKPKVIIGPNSKVLGELVLRREVELYLHDSAEVGGVTGEMSLSDAVRFSGDRP